MVGAHVHRIPFRRLTGAKQNQILRQPQRSLGRVDVRASRQVLLDDVVLGRALKLVARRALLVGDRDIKRHEPRRGGVDGHRGVHRGEGDLLEQRPHVAYVGNRHANLADFTARQRVIASRPFCVGRSNAMDSPVCPFAQVLSIEPVRLRRRRMASVSAEDPRFVPAPPRRQPVCVRHRSPFAPIDSGAHFSFLLTRRFLCTAQSQKTPARATLLSLIRRLPRLEATRRSSAQQAIARRKWD